MTSTAPPAENGTTTVMARLGYSSSAIAMPLAIVSVSAAKRTCGTKCILILMRPIALHARAVHVARLRHVVVGHRQMPCRTIVPDHQIALGPPVAIHHVWLNRVLEQKTQDCPAFRLGYADDLAGKTRIHEQYFLAGFGMSSHDRMLNWLNFGLLFRRQPRSIGKPCEVLLVGEVVVMDCGKSREEVFHRLAQLVVGANSAGKHCVAAIAGYFESIKKRGKRRFCHIGAIGVPVLTGTDSSNGLSCFLHIRDDEDVRIFG